MMAAFLGSRVVPVCTLRSVDEAERLGEALVAGGLPLAEVTLRSPDGLEGLAAMARVPGLTVGAGTVRTATQLRAAAAAGASFAVSPCLTPSLAAAARALALPFIPGVATPSEIQLAVEEGFQTVKLFPAEALGGVPTLRALTDVFKDVDFMPTGGINQDTAHDYLALDRVVAVGGSWMLPGAERTAGDWDAVTRAVASCVDGLAAP